MIGGGIGGGGDIPCLYPSSSLKDTFSLVLSEENTRSDGPSMRVLMTATANITGRRVGSIMAGSITAGTVETTVAGWVTTAVVAVPPSTTACSNSGPAGPSFRDGTFYLEPFYYRADRAGGRAGEAGGGRGEV